MNIPLLGFLAQVFLYALPITWLFLFLEKKIVGVKSNFWDAFLACFLYLIANVVINIFMLVALNSLHWGITDSIWVVLSVVVWFWLTRKILKLESGHCLKISTLMIVTLYAFGWVTFLLGFELSIVI